MDTNSGSNQEAQGPKRLSIVLTIVVALLLGGIAISSPVGAGPNETRSLQEGTAVLYKCPEGSVGAPAADFPFCSVLSDVVVASLVTTIYECAPGDEPAGGEGPTLVCKPEGAEGQPGGLFLRFDPETSYTCPRGATGNPTSEFPFCTLIANPLELVPAVIASQTCPPGTTVSGTINGGMAVIESCLQSVADRAPLTESTYSCPAGTEAIGEPGPDLECTRATATLVPSIEQIVPLCDGAIPTIAGTEDRDIIRGTDGDDVIVGLGGNDVIRGLGGNDKICGNSGRDRLFGGPGEDIIHGGTQNDAIKGDQNADILFGNEGRDRLIGGTGNDHLEGGAGTVDRLDGKGGTDTCIDRQPATVRISCE